MIPLNGNIKAKGIDKTMTYDAFVVDNNDPERICQVRARVSGIMDDIPDENLPWIRPAMGHVEGYKGGNDVTRFGTQFVPQRGAKISVTFPSGSIYEGQYNTSVRMTTQDQLPEFQTNYPHRIGWHLSNGLQVIVDRSTNEMFFINPGDYNIVIMGDVNQTIVGNQSLVVTGDKGDVPAYILNDPNMMVKSLKSDPKKRISFKGLAKGTAGNQSTIVKGHQTLEVFGNRKTTIHGSDTLDVKKDIAIESGAEVTVNGATINLN